MRYIGLMVYTRTNRWATKPVTRALLGGALGVVMALSLVGCSDYRKLNEQNPYYQKAEAARARGDYDSAVSYFQECLKFSPESMKAHLQLGIIYEEQMKDYPRAIVHYKSFYDSVNGQNEDVQRMLDRVKKLYLQQLLETYSKGSGSTTIASNGPVGAGGGAHSDNVVSVPPKGSGNPGGQRTYIVKERDSLSGISIKVYGTSKHWERIFEANRSTLASPEKIKVGQTLIIPDLDE